MSFTPYKAWRYELAGEGGHGMGTLFVGELQHGQRKWALRRPRFRPWAGGALTHIKYILSTQVRNESPSPSVFREEEDCAHNDTNLPPPGMQMLDTLTVGTLRLVMATLPHTGRYWCQPPQATTAAATSQRLPQWNKRIAAWDVMFSLIVSFLT